MMRVSLVTYQGALTILFRNLCNISIFELEAAPHSYAISPDSFKGCLVQQQLIFDRQLLL